VYSLLGSFTVIIFACSIIIRAATISVDKREQVAMKGCNASASADSAAGRCEFPMPNTTAGEDEEAARDLLIGTALISVLVLAAVLHRACAYWVRRKNRLLTIGRSLHRCYSCPDLVKLRRSSAIYACAEMMAAFETRKSCPGSPLRAEAARKSRFNSVSLLETVPEPTHEEEHEAFSSCSEELSEDGEWEEMGWESDDAPVTPTGPSGVDRSPATSPSPQTQATPPGPAATCTGEEVAAGSCPGTTPASSEFDKRWPVLATIRDTSVQFFRDRKLEWESTAHVDELEVPAFVVRAALLFVSCVAGPSFGQAAATAVRFPK